MKKFKSIITVGLLLGLVTLLVKIFSAIRKLTKNGGKTLLFGGINKTFRENVVEENHYNLILSGLNLDFKKMPNPPKEINLILNARFSGVNIKLPEKWNVILEGKIDKGGINNHTEIIDEPAVTLKIAYDFKYSGMNIKV